MKVKDALGGRMKTELMSLKLDKWQLSAKIKDLEVYKDIYDRLSKTSYDNSFMMRVMKECVWVGMTKEELIAAHGQPSIYNRRELKTKTSETFKYHYIGRTVIVEKDSVVKVLVGTSNNY